MQYDFRYKCKAIRQRAGIGVKILIRFCLNQSQKLRQIMVSWCSQTMFPLVGTLRLQSSLITVKIFGEASKIN